MPMLAFDAAPRGTPGFGLRKGLPLVIPLKPLDVATSIHESGHVIANLVQGVQITEVGIALDGSGFCGNSKPTTTVLPAVNKAAIYVAGLCANEIAGNVKPPRSYSRDLRKLRKLARAMGMDDEETYHFFAHACGRARTLLKDNWPAVLAISKKLIRQRTMRGDEILQTFKEASLCSP